MFRTTMAVTAVVVFLAGTGTAVAGLLPSFGVKAGLNFSSIDLDEIKSSPRTGYVAGVFVNLGIPGLNLQGEALYTVKGFKKGRPLSTGSLDPGFREIEYREHFIQIPVLAKLSLPIPLASPSVYAGPAVSFPLKGEANAGAGWTEMKMKSEGKVWSIIIGADVTLVSTLVLDVRFDWGLSKIRETKLEDVFHGLDTDMKDRTFSAMLGYKF